MTGLGWSVEKTLECCDAVAERFGREGARHGAGAHLSVCKCLVRYRLRHQGLLSIIQRWYTSEDTVQSLGPSDHVQVAAAVALGDHSEAFAQAFLRRTVALANNVDGKTLAGYMSALDAMGLLTEQVLREHMVPPIVALRP